MTKCAQYARFGAEVPRGAVTHVKRVNRAGVTVTCEYAAACPCRRRVLCVSDG
eukprot:COSAG02_NODE_32379_length_517_cov_0.854067_1_plen_52_part_10